MSTASLLVKLYRASLGFYPRRFREEYALEMEAVFQATVNQASLDGKQSVLQTAVREAADLPLAILSAHLQENEVKNMLERFLHTNQFKRSRRAGAIGFAVSFFVVEGINIVRQFGSGGYVSTDGLIKINTIETPFAVLDWIALVSLFLGGLLAGWILSCAGTEWKPVRVSLAAGAAQALSYIILIPPLRMAIQNGIPSLGILAGIAMLAVPILMGALTGGILKAGLPGATRQSILRTALSAGGGYLLGMIASTLTAMLLFGIGSLLAGAGFLLAGVENGIFQPHSPLILGIGMFAGLLSSAVNGWVFGSFLGGEAGANLPRPVTAE